VCENWTVTPLKQGFESLWDGWRSFFVLYSIYYKVQIMARKEKKYHFIYKTINKITSRYYYGMHSTDNLDDGYLGSGKRLRRSINKYGEENHKREIIEFCDNRESLKNKEKELINLNEVAKKDCMNLMVGGSGGAQRPEKQRNWILAGSKGFTDRIKNDDEFREKIKKHLLFYVKENHKKGKYNYATFTNKKHSEETKQKMSESHKGKGTGKNNSQYGSCWITKNNVNKSIKKEELEHYINIGWIKGRIM